jgi:hypothetical protein
MLHAVVRQVGFRAAPIVVYALSFGLLVAQPAGPATVELGADEQAAIDSIRASQIMPMIRFLASSRLEGRESGVRGGQIAADYLVSAFQAVGLEAGTKEGFKQGFDLRYRTLGPDAAFELERRQGDAVRKRQWKPRRDYFPLTFSEEGEVEAPVVFAGYGIEAPEHGWDDYAALGREGARGKIVLVFRHEPDEEGETDKTKFDGREMTLHASIRQKVRVAARHGAVGLILVDDPLHEIDENPASSLSRWRVLSAEDRQNLDDDEVRYRGRADTRDAHHPLGLVAVHASQEILRWLDPDRDWESLYEEMNASWRPQSIEFPGVTARLVHQAEARYRRTANVIGVLRGSDPELSKEYVLIGGHFDHVGKDEESGEIYNGADDNASGTASVVAVAGAFAALPEPPKRSLIFAGWAAEEKGLLGSNWFVHHPPVELAKIVAAVNLDMVGRNDEAEISVVGRTETPDLVALFDRFADTVGLKLNDDAGAGASRSDNGSLWLAGIPTASLFAGTHEDYHEPSDTAGKIVPGKVERAAKLSFLVMNAIAGGETTPAPLKVPAGPWDPIAPPDRVGITDDDQGGAE